MDINTVELMFLLNYDGVETWTKVDIDQNSSFSFNIQSSDITDPTAVKIPFSYQIDLPKTKHNKDVFNNIGIYDALLIKMSAIERTEFRLYISGNLYQQGYFKLENVTINQYKIRLYGGLGDYFYELSDTSSGDSSDMYLKNLDFGTDFNHTINRAFVINSWGNIVEPSSGILSYFGYAMTYQGAYDNFDSDKVLNGGTLQDATWTSAIDNKTYSEPTLNEHRRNVRIGSSTLCGQFVSYYQRPKIKLKKLFLKIVERMQQKGWTTNLDSTFFNDANPYWADVWCILPQYSTDGNPSGTEVKFEDPAFTNGTVTGNFNRQGPGDASGQTGSPQPVAWGASGCRVVANLGTLYENSNLEGGQNTSPSTSTSRSFKLNITPIRLDDATKTYNFEVYLPLFVKAVSTGNNSNRQWKSRGDGSTSNSLNISCNIIVGGRSKPVNQQGSTASQYRLSDYNTYRQNNANARNWYYQDRGDSPTDEKNFNNPSSYIFADAVTFNAGEFSPGATVVLEIVVSGDTKWYGNGSSEHNYDALIKVRKEGYISYSDDGQIGIRSQADITYSDIMQSNETCLDFMLSYCKSFGMYFVKDPYSKTVDILTRNTYYGGQERLDWTEKIDYSRDWNEEIAMFDYKIGLLKWRDTDSKYETEYLEKYSKEYGSLRLNNNYGFSDDTNDYFSDNIFSNCVIAIGYDQYFLGRTSTLYQDNKTIPYLQDSAGDGVNSNFILVFREYPGTTVENNRQFIVSDDNSAMLTYGYCWSEGADLTQANRYPTLRRTITKDNQPYSLYFGSPAQVYNDDEGSGTPSTTEGQGTIYNRFWASYLRDRFDKDTRKLTCYVMLSIGDIQSDLLRKFIFINNTAWVINKIVGFNPLSKQPTKVELIKVKDINNYISQQYIAGTFIIRYPAGGDIIYNSDTGVDNTVIRLDSSSRTLTFTFTQSQSLTGQGWTAGPMDGLTITPSTSKTLDTTVSVVVPENNTGSVRYYYIPVRWGNTTTIITLVQVSNWTVTTSADPALGGTTTATGGGNTGQQIQVADSVNVTLSVYPNAGYGFLYWTINGAINNTPSPIINVQDDINAVANMYDATLYTKLNTQDPYTSIPNATKYDGYFWLLNIGQDYTFTNNQSDLSGYLFNSENQYRNPDSSFDKTISSSDSNLTVYYNTLLANLIVNNISDYNFNAVQILISGPSGVAPNPTGIVTPGNSVIIGYEYQTTSYGNYTFGVTQLPNIYVSVDPASYNYQLGNDIPNVSILVENLKWGNAEIEVDKEGETFDNFLYVPEAATATITSSLAGVTFNPTTITGGDNITFTVPENTTTASRTITITAVVTIGSTTIRTLTFTILQLSNFTPEISVNKTELTFTGAVTTDDTVTVTSNDSWTATPSDSWITITPTSGSPGDGIATSISVTQNTTGADRTGTITLSTVEPTATETITIQQSGALGSYSARMTGRQSGSFGIINYTVQLSHNGTVVDTKPGAVGSTNIGVLTTFEDIPAGQYDVLITPTTGYIIYSKFTINITADTTTTTQSYASDTPVYIGSTAFGQRYSGTFAIPANQAGTMTWYINGEADAGYIKVVSGSWMTDSAVGELPAPWAITYTAGTGRTGYIEVNGLGWAHRINIEQQ